MLLIKNGTIIEGTNKPAYRADILISGDKISAIGTFPKKQGVETIDALGAYVTPGFIDINSDSDHQLTLFTNPSQNGLLLQGITTIIGGHCGASLAPLLYGSLESIRKWSDVSQVNVNWHTTAEFFNTLQLYRLGVNFGTLMGHATIRRALIGEDLRDLTDKELIIFESIIDSGMREGALGLSTGLGYAHSSQAPHKELARLTKVIARYGGIYSTHLRSEESGLETAIQETIKIATENKLSTLISHLRPLIGFEKYAAVGRQMLRNLPADIDLHYDTYPFAESIVPLYTFLPHWAKRGNLEGMLEHIETPFMRDQIKSGLSELRADDLTIADAPYDKYLIGKTLADFAKDKSLAANEALLRLMAITRMRALILYKNINLKVAEEMIFDNRALIATNSTSFKDLNKAILPPRASKTFTRYLELAFAKQDLTPEKIFQKITALPAKKLRLGDRGVLRQGKAADLCILQKNIVRDVIINGVLAVKDGVVTGVSAGHVLKR